MSGVSWKSWATLGLLSTENLLIQCGKFLLPYLSESSAPAFRSITTALHLSDIQLAWLTGLGFAALYIIAGVLAGALLDRVSPAPVVVFGSLLFAVATACHSLSRSFIGILIPRMLVGIGEAFFAPAAYLLLYSAFEGSNQTTLAIGLFSCGVYAGVALASGLVSLSYLIGWRLVFVVVGCSLLVIVIVQALFVGFSPRRKRVSQEILSVDGVAKKSPLLLLISRKVFWSITLAGALRFVGGYALGAFLPTYFSRKFPSKYGTYSQGNLAIVGVGGSLSSFLGGYLTDQIAVRSSVARKNAFAAAVPSIGALIAAPLMLIVLTTGKFYLSMVCLALAYVSAEAWFGPAVVLIQKSVEGTNAVGSALGIYTAVGGMIGNCGPLFTVYLSGGGKMASASQLGRALSIVVLFSYCSAALFFILTGALLARNVSPEAVSSEKANLVQERERFSSSQE